MKPVVILCVASLAANVLLATRLLTRPSARPNAEISSSASSRPASLSASDKNETDAQAAAATTVAADDFPTLKARLLAAGLPADVVKMALAMSVHRHYQKRRDVLLGKPDPDQYWRNQHRRQDPADLNARRALDREERTTLREMLGGDMEFSEDENRRQYGNLPPEKVAKLKRIFADYSDLEEQLFSEGVDRNAPDVRARAELLAKEKRADLERTLTAEELLDYDLRNSPAAHRLRGRIGSFQATEEEFRTLYPIYKATLDAHPDATRRPTRETQQARAAAEATLESELRRVLGEARFAELQDANDHGLQETRALIASLNLPPHTAASVIAVQKEFQPRLQALERDRDLSPNQRDAQLANVGAEAQAQLIRLLGASGFEAYKRRGGGWVGAALNRPALQRTTP